MQSLTLGTPKSGITYELRTAVRCLIIKDNKICLIHVKNGNYHKLPGGGIEPSDPSDTISCQREALEETGCEISVESECFAKTIEFRGDLKQESRAYVCAVERDTGKVELTELEAGEGLVHFWCAVEEAVGVMKGVEPTSELGGMIQRRDVFLVEAYLKL